MSVSGVGRNKKRRNESDDSYLVKWTHVEGAVMESDSEHPHAGCHCTGDPNEKLPADRVAECDGITWSVA